MQITSLTLVAALAFLYRRTLTYLHVFQQDEYDSKRFLRWIRAELAVDRKVSLALAVLALLSVFRLTSFNVAQIAICAIFLLAFSLEPNPKRQAKKALVMTDRAKRIFYVALACSVAIGIAVKLAGSQAILWLVAVQLAPLTLVLSTALLAPGEKRIQRRYWTEAHDKLLSLKPIVVGITGSFGKTSVKHILGHILETQAPTLITPGSVNTPMGISRVIRERLLPEHKYFIAEMGAYGPGSIARICELVPPQVGLLVSIGLAHHERFRTLEAVARTKLELAQATPPGDGNVILSEDFVEFAPVKEFLALRGKQCVIYGSGPESALRILSTASTAKGVEAEVMWQGATFQLHAPLFGEHHAKNIALAFGAARSLGISADDAKVALATTPQIKHRLEVRNDPSGATVIDDAYNSNPTGFANGLRLLNLLRKGSGRRILVTPGMVELGDAHDTEHAKVGRLAAECCDLFLAVKPDRIRAMLAAFTESGGEGKLLEFQAFSEAQAWLRQNLRAEDIVLLENDLPDLYERKLSL